MSWPKICLDKSINSLLVENIEYMTYSIIPCTFVEILQPRRLLTKKQNGLCCGYLSGFLVAQKTKRARGNSEVSDTQNLNFGSCKSQERNGNPISYLISCTYIGTPKICVFGYAICPYRRNRKNRKEQESMFKGSLS